MSRPDDAAIGTAADGAVNVAVDARGAIARIWFGRNSEQLSFETLAAGLVEANDRARVALTSGPLPTVVPARPAPTPPWPVTPAPPAAADEDDDEDEVAGFTRG